MTVSLAASQVEVGSTIIAAASAKDRSGQTVAGKTFTWQSSSSAVATVTSAGIVSGVSPGEANITATVDGKTGSATVTVIPLAVASVSISNRTPSVRQGETIQLTAETQDAIGRPLPGRAVSWVSNNPVVATVNGTGLVTGVSAGNAFIVAASEGKRDSVSLRVRSLNAPTVSTTAPSTWQPGAAVTINGANFSTTPSSNEVLVNGVAAVVSASTPTMLTITVPSSQQLPCSAEGPVPVIVIVNGDSATGSANLKMATPRALAVGQSLMLTSQADVFCNEFSTTGGRYLVTAFNYAQSSSTRISFQLQGASRTASVQSYSQLPPASPPAAGPLQRMAAQSSSFGAAAHLQMLDESIQRLNRHPRLLSTLQSRRSRAKIDPGSASAAARMAFSQLSSAAQGEPVAPPSVGDKLTKRMRRTYNNAGQFDEIRARVVYVGPRIIILEDTANALAGTMDAEFQALGAEFDANMYGYLASFGDPQAIDSLTDNNGRVIALFSKRVNEYNPGGGAGGLLGFVTSCDFFPQSDPVPSQACPSSNEGEYFYAFVPNPGGAAGTWSLETWKRWARGTMIHEMKHIVMFVERIKRSAATEEIWLEEATAQQASELWARRLYNSSQKGEITWANGPRCDYAALSATCPDPVEGILHHFGFLYTYYAENETRTPINNSDQIIYGGSWSFARWLTDMFDGGNEGNFLRTLVQQSDRGVANVVARSGQSWSTLVGLFSMASLADNYPGAVASDNRLRLPSWDTRDMFSNMSAFLVFRNPDGSTTPAFPLPWPLRVRAQSFGNFPDFVRTVSQLPGGTFAAWDIGGTQTSPQVLAIRSINGGLPPANVGMMVLRIQ
ncbi:MAG: Ig-like domain-containing protein [Gemmatimonadota bacterium]